MVELSDQERLDRAVRSLRNMIRDKPELNRLLLGSKESSDEELRQALLTALIDWNMTPPQIGHVTLANHPNKGLLLKGAAIEVIRGAGLWHSREHMPSHDGGTSADDHAKASEYMAWMQPLVQEYEQKKSDLKTSINITQAFGSMTTPSEYAHYYSIFGEIW